RHNGACLAQRTFAEVQFAAAKGDGSGNGDDSGKGKVGTGKSSCEAGTLCDRIEGPLHCEPRPVQVTDYATLPGCGRRLILIQCGWHLRQSIRCQGYR